MRTPRATQCLFAALFCLYAASVAIAQNIHRFTLDNGMRVALQPTTTGDTVAILTLIDVGERHDPPGQSGIAHALEHFLATCATDESEATHFDELMRRYGGQINAQTGEEYTLLSSVVHAQDLERELRLAAARLTSLRITQADLDRELPRLELELRNMHGGIPAITAANAAKAATLPLQQGARKGGVIDDIRAITPEAYSQRLKEHYGGATTRLIVVGRFDAASTMRIITELFENVRPASPPGDPHPRAPRADDPARLGAPPAAENEVWAAFPMPDRASPHFPASIVIASRLTDRWPKRDGVPFPVVWAPLDQPEVLTLSLEALPNETTNEAIQRLDALVRDIALARSGRTDAANALARYGAILGATPIHPFVAVRNPYFAAMILGRNDQIGGFDGDLARAVRNVDDHDLRTCYEAIFAPSVRGIAVWEDNNPPDR